MRRVTLQYWLLWLLCDLSRYVSAKRSRSYELSGAYCPLNKDIDGALLYSGENFLRGTKDCVMRFATDDDMFTDKKMMILFEEYDVTDCNFELKVTFSSRGTTDGRNDEQHIYDCKNRPPEALYNRHKYTSFTFTNMNPLGYKLRIVLTVYRERTFCGGDYRCGDNQCVDDDLQCDGVKNCPNGRDELGCHTLSDTEIYNTVKLGMGALIGVVVACIVVCLLCTCVIVICCRRQRQRGTVIRKPSTSTEQQSTTTTTAVGGPAVPQYPVGYQPAPMAPPQAPMGPPPAYGHAYPPGGEQGYYPPASGGQQGYYPPAPGGQQGYYPPSNVQPYTDQPQTGGQIYPQLPAPQPAYGQPDPSGQYGGPPPPGQVAYNTSTQQVDM